MGSAAASGEVEVLEYLLGLGVRTDTTCTHETPFERAAANARTEAALLLLARGAALRVSRSGAVVAASRAAGHGELRLLQTIVAAAAPLGGSASDRFGEALSARPRTETRPSCGNPITLLSTGRGELTQGHLEAVDRLLARGADPNARTL